MNDNLAALFGDSFDIATVEPQSDFQVLPPSKYPCVIEAAEVKLTKAATGHYIKLTLCVMDGPGKNRKLFDQINIDNPSAQCVEIGLRCLAALVESIGLQGEEWKNLDFYLNKITIAHVKVGKDQNGNDQNNIRTYSAPTEAGPTQADCKAPVVAPAVVAPEAPPPVAHAQQATATKPPWQQ